MRPGDSLAAQFLTNLAIGVVVGGTVYLVVRLLLHGTPSGAALLGIAFAGLVGPVMTILRRKREGGG
jgi:hypothetical protein